jgi:hypothetical protein
MVQRAHFALITGEHTRKKEREIVFYALLSRRGLFVDGWGQAPTPAMDGGPYPAVREADAAHGGKDAAPWRAL